MEGYDKLLTEQIDGTRGVALYVKQKFKAQKISFESGFQENKWVTVKLQGNDTLLIGCIYRSLKSTEENTDNLNNLLLKICELKEHTFANYGGLQSTNKWTRKLELYRQRRKDIYGKNWRLFSIPACNRIY